jgi:hypothetical protein
MYKLVRIGFKFSAPVVVFLIRSAKNAFTVFPIMLCPFKQDIPRIVVKGVAYGILARGVFGTIHGTPGQVGGQFGDGYTIELIFEDMIYPVMQIGDFFFQSL